ncbi:MAG: MBL fold metallo-hydrolase [Ginsengibacter sp.]
MSLFITSLNSGSNGNCYYAGNTKEAILIDAGITCTEIEKRLKRLGLFIQNVKAVFISHEHSDHIKGVAVLCKKYRLPVYVTSSTLQHCGINFEQSLINTFKAHEQITIGNLYITPLPKMHDACDPYSFVISCNDVKVGVFTDIGTPCKNLVAYFAQCHAAFLEANYDDAMLQQGNYPWFLKKRISGGMGHLSNKQALEIFLQHRADHMTHLFLSHLSKNNNCPKLVVEMFRTHANGVEMVVASRDVETPVYHITHTHIPLQQKVIKPLHSPSQQLTFAF